MKLSNLISPFRHRNIPARSLVHHSREEPESRPKSGIDLKRAKADQTKRMRQEGMTMEACRQLVKSARILFRNGWQENALRLVDEALSIDAAMPYVWHTKVQMLSLAGNNEGAKESQARASSIFPNYDFWSPLPE